MGEVNREGVSGTDAAARAILAAIAGSLGDDRSPTLGMRSAAVLLLVSLAISFAVSFPAGFAVGRLIRSGMTAEAGDEAGK